MTRNQIEYQRLLETKRANLAQEALTSARDAVNAEVSRGTLAESKRHNVAYEAEVSRHNIATESETVRHNVAVENQAREELGIKQATLDETKRHNVAGEGLTAAQLEESKRHNIAQESIGRTQAAASMMQAQASMHQAETSRMVGYSTVESNYANADRARADAAHTRVKMVYEPLDYAVDKQNADANVWKAQAAGLQAAVSVTKPLTDLTDTIVKSGTNLATGAMRMIPSLIKIGG